NRIHCNERQVVRRVDTERESRLGRLRAERVDGILHENRHVRWFLVQRQCAALGVGERPEIFGEPRQEPPLLEQRLHPRNVAPLETPSSATPCVRSVNRWPGFVRRPPRRALPRAIPPHHASANL